MKKCFNRMQTLKSREDCDKFSKSVSYETLVVGTATTGRERKQTQKMFLGSANKPLTAVGTLTSLLCNSAKVMEKLLHRHPERSEGSIKNNIKDWILRFANTPLRMTMKRRLRMTIPTLAFLLSFNLSPSFAEDCVQETTIINGVEKPLVVCNGKSTMFKYTYNSSGNVTNTTVYNSDGSGWKTYADSINTYDSSGNLESIIGYFCGSGNCEQDYEYKYKLDTAPDGTKIAKEFIYWCSNGVCEKDTKYVGIYVYNDDTFTGDWDSYGDGGYWCGKDGYECDTEFPQSISATPFCPKGCDGCDTERACSSCAEGYKKIDTWCNKIRWTPVEAAKVLTDDNNNSVTITFKK